MDDRRDTFQVRSIQYGAVGLAIFVLFVAASTLTGVSERLHAERAAAEFQTGEAAERAGDCKAAIQHYRTGLELAAEEPSYRLALARCLWREGRGTEADTYLTQVLGDDPTDGEANLLRAQVFAGNGSVGDAVVYFERAITGSWPQSNAGGRFRARMELVDLLYRERRWRDLVPQLLQLREDSAADDDLRLRIAGLLLEAGAPEEARATLAAMVRAGLRRADAYAGLGRAYLAVRQPAQARQAFRSAQRLARGNPWIEAELAFANAIVRLDPGEPGLNSALQRLRLVELGRIGLGRAERCTAGSAVDPVLIESAATLDRAERRPASVETDRLRSLAGTIWRRSAPACQPSTAEERAVEYLIASPSEPEAALAPAEPEQ